MDGLIPFRNPEALLALILPAALLFWVWGRHRGNVAVPFDHGTAPRGAGLGALLRIADSLPALLLAVVIFLLAGPQRWDEPQTKKVLTNIEFCVDVSGSMTAKFGSGDRYEASMQAINEFLDYREGDAFGLTFFGNQVLHWVPLTTDVSAFRCAPPFMRPQTLPGHFNGTEIGKALLACRRVLVSREEGDRMIVLVSDGYSADLGGDRDMEIAKTLRDERIVVYAVHIAGSEAPDSIVNITNATGGDVYVPGDPEGLRLVFQAIDAMQQTRVEKLAAETVDHYGPWATWALGLAGASLLVLFGLRSTPW
jgi:Ca-activated chloride channel family protein